MKKSVDKYGQALFELGENSEINRTLYKESCIIVHIFNEEPRYRNVLASPLIRAEDKANIVEEWIYNCCTLLQSLVKLLIERNEIDCLHEILKQYTLIYEKKNKISSAVVKSAIPLNENIVDHIKKILQDNMGKQIEIENVIDRKYLGGFQVEVDGKRYDTSVKNKLDQIYSVLKESAQQGARGTK
ncbi:MAG: ATP synthase F1 subunit delta [Lachnospiraceae bacterium]